MWTIIMKWLWQPLFFLVLALSLRSPVPFWNHAIFLPVHTLRTSPTGSVDRFAILDKWFCEGVLENKCTGQILLPVYVFREPAISQHNSLLTPDTDQDLTDQILW